MNIEDIIWIVVLIITSFGGSILKLFRSKSDEETEESAQPASHTQWEDEVESFEGMESFDVMDEEMDESTYFTYEDEKTFDPIPQPVACEPAAQPVVPSRVAEMGFPAKVGNEEFDLRKAIIYQTILQNDYIRAEK